MAKRFDPLLQGEIVADLANSFGPFIAVGKDYFFDARLQKCPLWLGYNASPLLGMAQFIETWTGDETEQINSIKKACSELKQRKKSPKSLIDLPRPAYPIPTTSAGSLYEYICLSVLEQFEDEQLAISQSIQNVFSRIQDKYIEILDGHFNLSTDCWFGFTFRETNTAERFAHSALRVGILPTFERSSRQFQFHLNLAYRKRELELFWHRLALAFESLNDESLDLPKLDLSLFKKDNALDFEYHQIMIEAKLNNQLSSPDLVDSFLRRRLGKWKQHQLEFEILDPTQYYVHREKILAMQSEVYEPARQSPPEEFDLLFESEKPLSILVFESGRLIAMTFAGKLGLFKQERGVTNDPYVDDPLVYYSMDLTVTPEFRGGMGRILKQAMCLLAFQNGVKAIHGRNRDRLARGMWAINLSLGSFELKHLSKDYPDEGQYRDCIYYRCPLEWERIESAHLTSILANLLPMVNGQILDKNIIPNR